MASHRIGIIGCGGMAHTHLQGYRAVAAELGEVVAACDRRVEALDSFCGMYGLRHGFTDAGDLIRSGEVDVVTVVTPAAVRDEVILPAVEAGVHLLVEKPFAGSLREALRYVEAAEQRGVLLAVNQQFRFMPDVLLARELITSGRLGEVQFASSDHFQNRTTVTGWRKAEERLEISIFSIHLIDRLRWLVGRPVEAVSAVTRLWNNSVRGETFTDLTLQFEGGAVGSVVSNWHSLGAPESRLRIDGTGGSFVSLKDSAAGDSCIVNLQPCDGELEQLDCTRENVFRTAVGESMRRLLAAVDTGEPPVHSGRDNLQTMAIVDAAYLSASRGGARISLEEAGLSAGA